MYRTALLACLALASAPVLAADDACVRLSGEQNYSRFGSQYLLVKDGESHYQVSFVGNRCSAISLTSKLKIKTAGEPDLICPSGTVVNSKNGNCRVNAIEAIDAERYAALRRSR